MADGPSLIRQTLQDVGTRYEHLQQLAEMWEFSAEMGKRFGYTGKQQEQAAKLEIAIEFLRNTLLALANYNDKQWKLAREVNDISKGGPIGDDQKSTEHQQ